MDEKVLPKYLGEKIKTLRKSAKYTQEVFSEKIGIEPQNLSRIERGLNFPSLAPFLKITEVLNIKPNDLLDVESYMEENLLENTIINIVKSQPLNQKRVIYKLVKAFVE